MKIRVLIAGIIYIIISIFLCFIPLFNYLGYEFSFIIGLLGSFISGNLTIAILKKKHPSVDELKTKYTEIFKKIYVINLLLLSIPFTIIIVNAIWVPNCSLFQGVAFYFMLPVISILYSVSLGIFSFTVFKKRKKLGLNLILVFTILYSVLIYYYYPQLYLNNPVFGYFSGMVYDEEMSISGYMLVYRLGTIVESLFLLFASITMIKRISDNDKILKRLVALKDIFIENRSTILLIVFIVLFWLFKSELHVVVNEGYIRSELGQKYETEHFSIFYSSKSYNNEEAKYIAGLHELYYNQIQNFLKIDFDEKIKSYIYPSADFKRSLIGAKFTNIAKPWLYQIHVNAGSLDQVLKHEIVHIMAGKFGTPVINAGILAGLVEGLAMAADWEGGYRTKHQYAAQLLKMNKLDNIDELLSLTGFTSKNPSYSYNICGSFCGFIIEKYGVESFKKLYPYGGAEKIYKKTFSQLNDEWFAFLQNINTDSTDAVIIKYIFDRPSIFQKECARVIANLNEKASDEYRNKNYQQSAELYRKSLGLSNSSDAQTGLILSCFQLNQYDSVINLTAPIFCNEKTKYSYLPLRIYRGDAFWQKAISENRKDLLDSALFNFKQLSEVNLGEYYTFASNIRINIISDSSLSKDMLAYLYKKNEFTKGVLINKIISEHPDFQIGKLILGEMLYDKKEYSEAVGVLNNIPENSINEYFKYEKHRYLGMSYFFQKDYWKARDHFQTAKEFQKSDAQNSRLDEWIEKCNYFEKQPQP